MSFSSGQNPAPITPTGIQPKTLDTAAATTILISHKKEELKMTAAKNNKTVLYLSLDMDGCLFNQKYWESKTGPRYSDSYDKNLKDQDSFINANSSLISSITTLVQEKKYNQTYLVLGSNRQSISSDINSAGENQPSCFPKMIQLTNEFKHRINTHSKVILDRFLMSDLFQDRQEGKSFDSALDDIKEGQLRKRYMDECLEEWVFDETKFSILYAQTHNAARKNPNAIITFHFYDDREDILNNLKDYFSNAMLLPRNVHLHFFHYNGDAASPYFDIQGTGEIDFDFEANIKAVIFAEKQNEKNIYLNDKLNYFDYIPLDSFFKYRDIVLLSGLEIFSEIKKQISELEKIQPLDHKSTELTEAFYCYFGEKENKKSKEESFSILKKHPLIQKIQENHLKDTFGIEMSFNTLTLTKRVNLLRKLTGSLLILEPEERDEKDLLAFSIELEGNDHTINNAKLEVNPLEKREGSLLWKFYFSTNNPFAKNLPECKYEFDISKRNTKNPIKYSVKTIPWDANTTKEQLMTIIRNTFSGKITLASEEKIKQEVNRLQDYKSAKELLEFLEKSHDNYSEADCKKAQFFLDHKKTPECDAYKIDPRASLCHGIGRFLFNQGKLPEAFAKFQEERTYILNSKDHLNLNKFFESCSLPLLNYRWMKDWYDNNNFDMIEKIISNILKKNSKVYNEEEYKILLSNTDKEKRSLAWKKFSRANNKYSPEALAKFQEIEHYLLTNKPYEPFEKKRDVMYNFRIVNQAMQKLLLAQKEDRPKLLKSPEIGELNTLSSKLSNSNTAHPTLSATDPLSSDSSSASSSNTTHSSASLNMFAQQLVQPKQPTIVKDSKIAQSKPT